MEVAQNQVEDVKAYLRENGSITQWEANKLGVMRVSERIREIEREPDWRVKIQHKPEIVVNMHGKKTRPTRYVYSGIREVDDEVW